MEDLPGFAAPTQPAPAAPGQNESIKINEQKSTIWFQKKIPKCKNSFKQHDFLSLYLLRLLGLLLPFQLSLKSTTSFTASHANICQPCSTKAPAANNSSLSFVNWAHGKNGKSEGQELYGIKAFQCGVQAFKVFKSRQKSTCKRVAFSTGTLL